MKLIADLHIHSRFSRATSKNLDFIALHRAALEKGIGLVGTGDFTHPGWMEEIENQLEPAEDGLFRLRPDLARSAEEGLPGACDGQVRFVLQVEISNIYKKNERTRKNHNLVFAPSIHVARAITEKLAAIGNVGSDGRPILGLDARDLLEITLESDPLSFLVPAHIWTPWFSMLGSKSGFDSIEECFGDLAGHIFAAETGLSSDPPMNWRQSALDHITLISNSDAHSAAKLGREANLLDIELGYEPLLCALRDRTGYLGTIEFFPEEGKYHLDGHRKCGLRLEPEETRELEDGRCPECGGKLTVGVMSRVRDLADRPVGFKPESAAPFTSLVPLAEVAGEVRGVGPQTKKARALVERVLAEVGPELFVLKDAPLEDIERAGGGPLAEAVRRVRACELTIAAGYDGEFGTVKIFAPGERDHMEGQLMFLQGEAARTTASPSPHGGVVKGKPAFPKCRGGLYAHPQIQQPRGGAAGDKPRPYVEGANLLPFSTSLIDPLFGLDEDQLSAAETLEGPLLVVAGPGAGKTRTLVARIANQIRTGTVPPEQVLAIAFTNQAAEELDERIRETVVGTAAAGPCVSTFHGLGLSLIREYGNLGDFKVLEDEERLGFIKKAAGDKCSSRRATDLLSRISLAKQSPDPAGAISDDEDLAVFNNYDSLLRGRNALDVDDLVLRAYSLLADDEQLARTVAGLYRSVSVDEYQDVNDVQSAFVKLLAPEGKSLLAIGDPNQAIYGFRGARPGHFARFEEYFPGTTTVTLKTTYRLPSPILEAARSVIGSGVDSLVARKTGTKVEVVACPTPRSEAEQILVRLERLIGGSSHFAIDSGRGSDAEEADIGFGDVAVLCRTKAQRRDILASLGASGIPCRAVGEDEPHDPRSEKVAVMTMHGSKGREFEIVFVTGVEQGLLPLDLEGLTSNPGEERRLLYVAITRAKRLAVLSYCARRTLFGKTMPGGPSPFLANLPGDAVTRTSPMLPASKPVVKQLSLF